ncbi:hypothetical protein IFM89_008630 [Coptis chinensis]|uniref:Receptor-like serine/threonine-protein kinase n=1 Tax=Coptis chinensis TaxID=261450 RepID=A0A835GVA8_9MAGN|nr:hypothetical protein IFM89_008630 [Coptis chinensis]
MNNIPCLDSFLLISIILLSVFSKFSISANTLVPKQSLRENQTLVSQGQRFELGFFSPTNSNNRYLAIWYKNISPLTVVWIANRNTPVTNSSGVFTMNDNGKLILLNQNQSVIWSSNESKQGNPSADKPIAKLLDSGNLVVTEKSDNDDDAGNYRWQSFDHATDTLLPGMKLGWDLNTGLNNSLVSWKSAEDPSIGDHSFVIEPDGCPEAYILRGQIPIYRSGPWNGIQFSGVPEMNSNGGFKFNFVFNRKQKYYSFEVTDESIISRLVIDEVSKLQRLTWLGDKEGWKRYWDAPKDQCDKYKNCGVYGICDATESPICKCTKGFQPRNLREWNLRDGSGGCVRKKNFVCGKDDGFLKLKGMKLPDTSKTFVDTSMNLKECKKVCEKNCSCTAYANPMINGGSGCIVWIGDLIDLREFTGGGQEVYVRVAASELDKHRKSIAIIITVVVVSAAIVGLGVYFVWKKRILKTKGKSNERVDRVKSQEIPLFNMFLSTTRDNYEENKKGDLELPMVDFHMIAAATENFSSANKLGQGGFGSVYKGTLADGQQIAVKRLSKNSGQGVEELKNEVMLIARLQNRYLVSLLGCCIEEEEKILIYEYVPNKSLDSFLFDKTKSLLLDWQKRFSIIKGIARGLLYLHQDSRIRIIHRDLKASNILLDDEMNPKISDFGMARIFGGEQTEASTTRVVGTYGYMSPEYAMDGLFSVKSDVFSYGVLVLEIVSGKKNRGFFSASSELNLLGHAWNLWKDGKGLELRDESMSDTSSPYEVLKCIQIALLCVQEHAEDRPTISSVLLMLGSETPVLAQPKEPGFSLGRTPNGAHSSSIDQETCSVNQVTITMLEARPQDTGQKHPILDMDNEFMSEFNLGLGTLSPY